MEIPFPPSTSAPHVAVKESIEGVMRFTLESSVNKILEFDLGLSNTFCSGLLNNDPALLISDSTLDICEGVPLYPLYRHVVSAMWECLSSGSFCQTYKNMKMMREESSLHQKENEWLKLIVDKGSEILNVLEKVDLEVHSPEPYFSRLKDGQKDIEGRCVVGDYHTIGPGNFILFNKSLVFEVKGIHQFTSFSHTSKLESLVKVLPGAATVEEGVQICWMLNEEDEERASGHVLAIRISKLALQPYISLASLLSELSFEGIQGLLGLVHTIGTVQDAVPPPRSALLSSFILPYKPQVKHVMLTRGARALAKHSERSSDRFWPTLVGSDLNKNKVAITAINRLITECCWMNQHIIPPHGVVFEIRISDGYGARWSKDGSKFIGFLEPYTEDGHSKGWKH